MNESLAPKEELTIWSDIEEIKRTNDVHYWAFKYATLNPQVTVEAYDGINVNVSFGYRLSGEELGFNTYRLSGTLLPHQVIEIRWWKEEDSVKWKTETDKSQSIV